MTLKYKDELGQWITVPTKGDRGPQGEQGKDGAAFTYDDFTPEQLESLRGANGNDGISPAASITQTANGATITITDASGTTTANITNGTKGDAPQKGVDYFTDEDKEEIVNDVLAALPNYEGVSF